MGWVTRWNVKSDIDRNWYLQKYGAGDWKTAVLEEIPLPADPLSVFRLEIKADSGEQVEGKEGFGEQSAHLQRQQEDEPRAHLNERNVTQHSRDPQTSRSWTRCVLKTNKGKTCMSVWIPSHAHHHPQQQSFVEYY